MSQRSPQPIKATCTEKRSFPLAGHWCCFAGGLVFLSGGKQCRDRSKKVWTTSRTTL